MSAPDNGAAPTRRAVLEGVGVAVVAAVGGYAWFSAVGPQPDDRQDELEDRQDELEDRRDDGGSGGEAQP